MTFSHLFLLANRHSESRRPLIFMANILNNQLRDRPRVICKTYVLRTSFIPSREGVRYVRRAHCSLLFEGGLGWVLIDIKKLRSLLAEEKVFYCSRLKFTLQFFPCGPAPIPAFPQGKEGCTFGVHTAPSLMREGWGGCLLILKSLGVY